MSLTPISLIPVTLIKISLAKGGDLKPVGRLALLDRRIWFEYDLGFIASGIELSPFRLPLAAGVTTCPEPVFDGLYGLFNDSLPDGWGRLLLDRQIQRHGLDVRRLTPLDRLAHVGHGGMGALVYEPDYGAHGDLPSVIELDQLAQETQTLLSGAVTGPADSVLEALLALNASSQGARPKIMVDVNIGKGLIRSGRGGHGKGFEPWIIKFAARHDPEDIGRVEYAYSLMAKAAGIAMPQTHLFETEQGGAFFGAQRFDRQHDQRVHMQSLSALIHADHRFPSLDYDMVLRVTGALTRDVTQIERAFALACFNVLARNRDDHAKNFAFVLDESRGEVGRWALSPAYDLTFSAGPNGEQSMTVMGEGRDPGIGHLQALAKAHGLKTGPDIIEHVRAAVRDWSRFADLAGVSGDTAQTVAQALTTPA